MAKRKTYKDLIGDGKLPNRYWVSLSNDYSYVRTEKGANYIDWIGNIIPSFKSKGKTIAKPFKTFRGALDFCNRLILGENNGFNFVVNRINIEDRLSGQVYEKTFIFNPETAKIREDENNDSQYTQKAMAKKGVEFV